LTTIFAREPVLYTITLLISNLGLFIALLFKQHEDISNWPTSIGWLNRSFRIGFCFTTICSLGAAMSVIVNDKASFFPLFAIVALTFMLALVEAIGYLRRKENNGKRKRKFGSALAKKTTESAQRDEKVKNVVAQNGHWFLLFAKNLRIERHGSSSTVSNRSKVDPLPTNYRVFNFIRQLCATEFRCNLDEEASVCELSVGILTAAVLQVPALNDFRDDIEELVELHGQELLVKLTSLNTNITVSALLFAMDTKSISDSCESVKRDTKLHFAHAMTSIETMTRLPSETVLPVVAKNCSDYLQSITSDGLVKDESACHTALQALKTA
jgi:hypothetical protein